MNQEEIMKLALDLQTNGKDLIAQYEAIEYMYFMDPSFAGNQARPLSDPNDIKLTISPSVRNNVIGLVRLLTTNEPHFTAKSESDSDKVTEIENLCEIIWRESCQVKRADLHVDLVRSAALYSDCHLAADSVDDLLTVCPDDEKHRLEEIAKRTPYLLEVRSPKENYLHYGRYGIRGVLRRYKTLGDEVLSMYKTDLKLNESEWHFVLDWIDNKHRFVWIEGNADDPLVPWAEHGLKEILFDAQVADGSELWREEVRRRQPFLYAMWKGNLWRRQNAVLTEIFTAINERGTGVLLGFDEVPENIDVKFAGPSVRYINAAKPRMLSDTAFDPSLIQLINQILNPLVEASTLYPQTLGSSEGIGSAPFSAIAMLSSSGQLPTVPIKKSVSNVIAHLMLKVLRRIKVDPPNSDLKKLVDMQPSDIPDDLELEVVLEIKLPQDMFKNIQIAETAVQMGLAPKAWVQENLMQVSDTKQMTKEIWWEQSSEQLYKYMLGQFMAKLPQTPPPPAPGSTPTPPATAPNPADQNAATAASGGPAGGVTTPGGSQAAAAGGGQIEASQPQAPAGTNPPTGGG